jgi:hypothetical protein
MKSRGIRHFRLAIAFFSVVPGSCVILFPQRSSNGDEQMKAVLNVARSRACISALALMAFAGVAQAGECPADKVKEGAVKSG